MENINVYWAIVGTTYVLIFMFGLFIGLATQWWNNKTSKGDD